MTVKTLKTKNDVRGKKDVVSGKKHKFAAQRFSPFSFEGPANSVSVFSFKN